MAKKKGKKGHKKKHPTIYDGSGRVFTGGSIFD
jgi:hypothetical protein